MKKTKQKNEEQNNVIQMPIRMSKTSQEWFELHLSQILRNMTPLSRDVAMHTLRDLQNYTLPLYPHTLIGPVFFEYKRDVEDAMVEFDYSYEEDPLWLFLKNHVALLGSAQVIEMVNNFLATQQHNKNRRAV